MKRLAAFALALAACGGDDTVHRPPDAPKGNAPPGIYTISLQGKVTVHALTAEGDAAPIRTIEGSSTGLGGSIGINVDSDGFIYVANRMLGTVTVYPKDGAGDLAPTRTLTGVGSPEAVGVTSSDEVIIASCPGCGGPGGENALYHFAKNAPTSDTHLGGAPNTNTMFNAPSSLGIDPADGTIWVANSFGGIVESFPAGSSGDIAPTRMWNPNLPNLQSMAFADNTLFITSDDGSIHMFPTTGTGTPTGVVIPNNANGLDVGYPGGIWVETSSGHPVIYLADADNSAIHIIDTTGTAPNLSVASVKTIVGATTGLSYPLGIRVIP